MKFRFRFHRHGGEKLIPMRLMTWRPLPRGSCGYNVMKEKPVWITHMKDRQRQVKNRKFLKEAETLLQKLEQQEKNDE